MTKFCPLSDIICCELSGYAGLIISKISRGIDTSFQGRSSLVKRGEGGELSGWISIFRLLFWKQNYLTLDLLKGVICLKYCLGVGVCV